MMQQTLNKQDRRLTVGLDLGDRSSFYCVLDEAGDVLMEQRLSTTPKAIKEIFGAMLGAVSHWRPERIHHG
jgi:transposase